MLDSYTANKLVCNWCIDLKISPRDVKYKVKGNDLYIYTTRPGLWIGKAGANIERFRLELNDEVNKWNRPEAQSIYCNIILEEVNNVMTPEEVDEYLRARCMMWGRE